MASATTSISTGVLVPRALTIRSATASPTATPSTSSIARRVRCPRDAASETTAPAPPPRPLPARRGERDDRRDRREERRAVDLPRDRPRRPDRDRGLGDRPQAGAQAARPSLDLPAQLGRQAVAVAVAVRRPAGGHGRHCRAAAYVGVCSRWPPNAKRIADRTLLANSSSSREANRENSEAVSTGAGTPSSIAACAVQRPSPESDTRPENFSSCGLSTSAAAVGSSSHEPTTLPRRQTSVIAATSKSYW